MVYELKDVDGLSVYLVTRHTYVDAAEDQSGNKVVQAEVPIAITMVKDEADRIHEVHEV